jgi:hypothetical protein
VTRYSRVLLPTVVSSGLIGGTAQAASTQMSTASCKELV